MKLSISPIAIAVSLALASASAHAALAPPPTSGGVFTPPASAPGGAGPVQTGFFLAAFDTTSNESDIVNLNYDISDVNLASGNLDPTTAGGAFSLAADPTGAAGQVLQVNFGQIPGFSVFTNTSTVQYLVVAGVSGGAGTEQAVVTSTSTPVTAFSGVGGLINHIQIEIAAWQATAPTQGFLTDTTGQPTTSPQTDTQALNNGNLITGQSFSGALGSALGLYNITTTSNHVAHDTAYSNGTSTNGFFFLASNGDLTYNIGAASAQPVPLPAAAWLLGSGLMGLVGVARRRRNAV